MSQGEFNPISQEILLCSGRTRSEKIYFCAFIYLRPACLGKLFHSTIKLLLTSQKKIDPAFLAHYRPQRGHAAFSSSPRRPVTSLPVTNARENSFRRMLSQSACGSGSSTPGEKRLPPAASTACPSQDCLELTELCFPGLNAAFDLDAQPVSMGFVPALLEASLCKLPGQGQGSWDNLIFPEGPNTQIQRRCAQCTRAW